MYSSTAEAIEFCVFDDDGTERRTTLDDRPGHVFHALVPDVGVGTRYALRAHGSWNPAAGLRRNPHKVLLDPHALVVGHDGADAFAVLLNAAENGVEFTVPAAPHAEWTLASFSDPGQQVAGDVTTLIVRDALFTLLRSAHDQP